MDGKIFINFIHNDGLNSSLANLTGFELAGEDQIYVTAEVKIINDHVITWSDDISDPKHIRHDWKDYFSGTLT